MIRVLKYQATVYHTSTGSSHTTQHVFTQPQADEVNSVLESDGLDYMLARQLCEKWTRHGNHSDIRYRYATLTEDDIRHYDARKQ